MSSESQSEGGTAIRPEAHQPYQRVIPADDEQTRLQPVLGIQYALEVPTGPVHDPDLIDEQRQPSEYMGS